MLTRQRITSLPCHVLRLVRTRCARSQQHRVAPSDAFAALPAYKCSPRLALHAMRMHMRRSSGRRACP